MRIVYIASYGPRKCGIATFTGNKFLGMDCRSEGQNEGFVIALNDPHNTYDYPEEVRFVIEQNNPADYIAAAEFINQSDADVCILEHEFGIFGGRDGAFILSLLHRLKIPIISVLHTVLKNPSHNQKDVTNEIAAISAQTVVMNNKAVEFLTGVYGLSDDKLSVIDHGIPDFEFDREEMKASFGLSDKKVFLTFGLISRNKGIETVLKALPPVIAAHPDVVYIILGKTHPTVVKQSGEEYREYLKALSAELGVEQNVMFVDEFTDEETLFKYLSATDIYITPYLNEAQITSGTLSYAVGAGCAVVSTPYWHAADLLSADKGRLFPFNDVAALTASLLELTADSTLLKSMQTNARAYGREVTWPVIGEKYLALAKKLIHRQAFKITGSEIVSDRAPLPAFALDHIKRMTDATGLFQHAKFGIPNYKEGYCLDDNARALLMVVMAYEQQRNFNAAELLPTYLSYIHYMQNDDGTFRNFLSFSRNFLDEVGSEDSFGRTIWALGYLMAHSANNLHYRSAREIFFNAAPNFLKLEYVRGIANTMIGISCFLEKNPDHEEMKQILRQLAEKLADRYCQHSKGTWKWFEPVLTYDNAILPLCMLHAAETLKDDSLMAIACDSMDFLSGISLKNGYLSVIGNEKWFARDEKQSLFAQQPIDAMMMVLLYQKAYTVTRDERYKKHLRTSFMWFLGENDLQITLYDKDTKGCFDGLESYGVNQNQGAESTLAYLISNLAYNHTFGRETDESLTGQNKQLNSLTNRGIAV